MVDWGRLYLNQTRKFKSLGSLTQMWQRRSMSRICSITRKGTDSTSMMQLLQSMQLKSSSKRCNTWGCHMMTQLGAAREQRANYPLGVVGYTCQVMRSNSKMVRFQLSTTNNSSAILKTRHKVCKIKSWRLVNSTIDTSTSENCSKTSANEKSLSRRN